MTGSVRVTGPPSAGVTTLVAALRTRLPGVVFAEDEDRHGADPAVVVFAVSAVAPMAGSDRALLRAAAGGAAPVLAAVTKTDAHHDWRAVLETNRAMVAAEFPDLPWAGVAAGPQPWLDDLVDLLGRALALPRRRPAPAARTVVLRDRVQRVRVALSHDARTRCAALRGELHDEIADLGRRRFDHFTAHVRRRAAEIFAEVDREVTAELAGVAADLGLPPPPTNPGAPPVVTGPALRPRRQENRLATLLGVGFGLGVALAVSRLLSGLDPGLTVAGLFAGGVTGLAVTAWVVGIRGLLHDRAALDRWVAEVCALLRSAADETVALRVLDAESAWTREAFEGRRGRMFGGSDEFAGRKLRVTDR
ncbi:hypothetical protein [Mycolicibacterium sp. F2034L]|uniref:hypothetical protein n=1 Tax=Mycolicibacterium sp. F2034L TaxID=2926422 RepID=UPI001FF2C805|nr:hypothetical protein [Mycolicibacterium sp. F2034L]MCK0177155.1 hypothetical protein [Mycolicibacterium sp. F2034L]